MVSNYKLQKYKISGIPVFCYFNPLNNSDPMNIIVTGASRGIGYRAAMKFALERGNKVIALSRNVKGLKALQQECLEADPESRLIVLPYDLENLEGIGVELRDRIMQSMDSLDILVNNAGLLVKKPIMSMSPEDASRMMTVNYIAPMVLVRTLLPLLEKSPSAHVVNIGSMSGMQGSSKFPGLSGYGASKAAVHILTECLALEFSQSSIRFNALALGAVQTEMLAEAFPGLEAPLKDSDMADFIKDFALNGHKYFNGKILPVAITIP